MMSAASAALCVQTAACITPPVVGGRVRVMYNASTQAPCKHKKSVRQTCCGQGVAERMCSTAISKEHRWQSLPAGLSAQQKLRRILLLEPSRAKHMKGKVLGNALLSSSRLESGV